jgi:hypothetical protein
MTEIVNNEASIQMHRNVDPIFLVLQQPDGGLVFKSTLSTMMRVSFLHGWMHDLNSGGGTRQECWSMQSCSQSLPKTKSKLNNQRCHCFGPGRPAGRQCKALQMTYLFMRMKRTLEPNSFRV